MERDLDKKILHNIFGLKEPYFLPNIATNLSKENEFANSASLTTFGLHWRRKSYYFNIDKRSVSQAKNWYWLFENKLEKG